MSWGEVWVDIMEELVGRGSRVSISTLNLGRDYVSYGKVVDDKVIKGVDMVNGEM